MQFHWERVGSGVVNGELFPRAREDNLEFEWLVCHELLDILLSFESTIDPHLFIKISNEVHYSMRTTSSSELRAGL